MGALYRLDFSSGKSYIGVTVGTPRHRYQMHQRSVKIGSRNAVHAAWRKYGAPRLVVLAFIEKNLLPQTEQRAVAVFKTFNPSGYNMTPGGEISPTSIPAIAAKLKGLPVSRERRLATSKRMRKNNPMHKAVHRRKLRGERSVKTKERISIAMIASWKRKKK